MSGPRGDWEGEGILCEPFVSVLGADCASGVEQGFGLGDGLAGPREDWVGGGNFV